MVCLVDARRLPLSIRSGKSRPLRDNPAVGAMARRSSAPDPLAENQAIDSQEVARLLRDSGVLNFALWCQMQRAPRGIG